ncbi:MAG: hypothetical protein ACKVQW_05550 [Pyrinomonadaceae bacterium]
MATNRTRIVGAGIALSAAFVFLLIAVVNFPYGTERMFGELKDAKDKLTLAQLVVSFFGFIGAISAVGLAIFQYRKSAKWKRMEFIANEVKEFESDPVVQNALLMIDWGTRKINLNNVSDPEESDYTLIEREDQWKALLPHPLKDRTKNPQYESPKFVLKDSGKQESDSANKVRFAVEEAKIRDTYDVFLTRLDRFFTFIDADLIDSAELRPFINYWIDAITENAEPEKDAKWRFALLAYIKFYDYSGVESLLKKYGKDIDINGEIYQNIMRSVKSQDPQLASDIFEQCNKQRL